MVNFLLLSSTIWNFKQNKAHLRFVFAGKIKNVGFTSQKPQGAALEQQQWWWSQSVRGLRTKSRFVRFGWLFFLFLSNIRTNSRNTSQRSAACRKSHSRVFSQSHTAVPGSVLPWPTSTFAPPQHLHHTPLSLGSVHSARALGQNSAAGGLQNRNPLPRADLPLTVEHLLPVRLVLDVFAPVAHIAQLLVLRGTKNTERDVTSEERSQTTAIILVGLWYPVAAPRWQ